MPRPKRTAPNLVTMEQIARRVGVTRATVSNVLNNRYPAARRDAAKRASEIRAIAAELGYRPNTLARAQRTGRTGCIGMLASANPNYAVHFGSFDQALLRELDQRDLLLVTGLVGADLPSDETHLPRVVAEHLADGFLINYPFDIPPGVTRMIEQHDLAAVWFNSQHPHDCVYPDDLRAAATATRYLLERGHRRIAYVQQQGGVLVAASHYSYVDRRLGYEREMKAAGLAPQIINAPVFSDTNSLTAAEVVLDQASGVTAILINGIADILRIVAAQRQIRIPQDLSIIAIQNDPPPYDTTDITHLLVPIPQMVAAAVDMLCDRVESGTGHAEPVVVAYDVIEGQSVRDLR
jgi:DNA-binding LacI/PurR family transcriptional regulator